LINIGFYGADRTVTGSRHLININGYKLLLDCGLFQGRRAETYERNLHFAFDPKSINSVIISHAHMDHLGDLPNLVKAFKRLDAAEPTGADSEADDRVDHMACVLYGALNLDEQQFGQVYSLMQKYLQDAKQKGLSETTPAPEKVAAVNQMIEQFKADTQPLLTPEQTRILAEVLTHIQVEPGKLGFTFNF